MNWTISAVKKQNENWQIENRQTDIETDSCIHMRLVWPSPPLAPWSKWMKSNTDIEKNRKKTKVNWFQATNKRPVIEEQQRAKAWQHCGWYSDEEKRHRSSKCLDRPLKLPFSAIAFAPRWSSWITVGSSRRKPNSLAILRGGTFFGPCAVRKWDFNDYDTLGMRRKVPLSPNPRGELFWAWTARARVWSAGGRRWVNCKLRLLKQGCAWRRAAVGLAALRRSLWVNVF